MRILTLFLTLLAVLFTVGAIYLLQEKLEQDKNSVTAIGVVSEVISASAEEQKMSNRALVTFVSAAGKSHTFISDSDLAPFYKVGESVAVSYPPEQPELAADASTVAKRFNLPKIFTVLALVLWSFAGVIILQESKITLLVLLGRVYFLGLGIFLLTLVGYGLYKDSDRTAMSTATVVGILTQASDDKAHHYPVLKFTTESGSIFTIQSNVGSSSTTKSVGNRENPPPTHLAEIGDKVDLIYSPKEPHEAKVKSFASVWLVKILLAIAGIVCMLVAVTRRPHIKSAAP